VKFILHYVQDTLFGRYTRIVAKDKVLSNRIAVFRTEHEMTQKDLAEIIGVSRQTIISIEKNRYIPSVTLAFDIANVFDVQIEEVFQYKEES